MVLRAFDEDTIVAVSTPLGEGGIGVVRLSGPEAIAIADKLFVSSTKKSVAKQAHMTAQYGHVVRKDALSADKIIDEVLLLVMRAPKSFTREDVVEISAHGGSAVLSAIVALAMSAGARLAERGEFTKRAFLNGRIDLLQAEAVLDLIRAKTELGREWAAEQLDGVLSKKMKAMKDALIQLLSHLEAAIDFPDDHLTPETYTASAKKLNGIAMELETLLDDTRVGQILKNGLKVVIAGRPNVGKSSLLNALCRKNRAIVTPFPGTTRDVVGEEIQLDGFPIRLFDTAGIHDTEHPIEKEGIARSKKEVADADLVLYVVDSNVSKNSEDEEFVRGLTDRPLILVLNKCDLSHNLIAEDVSGWLGDQAVSVECSSVSDGGTKKLESAIKHFITLGLAGRSEADQFSSIRQKEHLERAYIAAKNAHKACVESLSPELIAVDVRAALEELGMLVGEVYTDDILEVLFKQFCIGK